MESSESFIVFHFPYYEKKTDTVRSVLMVYLKKPGLWSCLLIETQVFFKSCKEWVYRWGEKLWEYFKINSSATEKLKEQSYPPSCIVQCIAWFFVSFSRLKHLSLDVILCFWFWQNCKKSYCTFHVILVGL